jgi:hypothetical protein
LGEPDSKRIAVKRVCALVQQRRPEGICIGGALEGLGDDEARP